MRNTCRRDGLLSRMAGLYKVLTQWPHEKGKIYAKEVQREEILLWGVSGGGYLSSIYPSKEKREAEQADNWDSAEAQSAAHRGTAAEAAAYQFHPVWPIRHIDLWRGNEVDPSALT